MGNNKIVNLSILLLSIVVIILYHQFAYIGHYGYDDLQYAEIANNLRKGIVDFDDHFTYRLPVIVLTACSYSLFGLSDFASSLPPLIFSVFILCLVFLLLYKRGHFTLIIGLALTIFSQWFIFYSDKLMPDIYLAFAVIFAVFLFHHYKFENKKRRPYLYSLLFILALLFGFTAKGTVVLLLPWLLYLFVADFVQKRDRQFWIYAIVNGIILISIYFFVTWYLTGAFTSRFDAIVKNGYLNACSYDVQSAGILLKRIFYDFFNMTVYQGMFTSYIFIFAFLIQKKIGSYFRLNDSFSFLLVSSIILFLSCNFMTISPKAYVPMCVDPRHYLFLIPVAAIPASIIIEEFLKERKNIFQIITGLVLIAILSFFLQGDISWKLYFPLAILFVLSVFLGDRSWFHKIFIVLFLIILSTKPWDMVKYARAVDYDGQKNISQAQIINKSKDQYIVTDPVQARLLRYYMGFETELEKNILSFNNFAPDTLKNQTALLYLNPHTMYLSGMEESELPYYAKNIATSTKLLYKNEDLNISVYALDKISTPHSIGKMMLRTVNNFEGSVAHWTWNPQNISDSLNFNGRFSAKLGEYSSTFSYPLDSINVGAEGNIFISSEVYCYFVDRSAAKLVISLENEDGAYVWEGKDINKYIKAYSNWWPVKFETEVKVSEIKEGSVLKVYVWNEEKVPAWIDYFKIDIILLEDETD